MEERLSSLLIEHSLNLQKEDILVVDHQSHTRDLLEYIIINTKNRGVETRLFFRPELTKLSDLEKLDGLLNGATSYMRLGGGVYKKSSNDESIELQRKEGDIDNSVNLYSRIQ